MNAEPVPNRWALVWNIPLPQYRSQWPLFFTGQIPLPRVAVFATEAEAREWANKGLKTAVFLSLYELREQIR